LNIHANYHFSICNSLAVKILEHLSSYYYVEEWEHSDILDSTRAHNISKRHQETSTIFVGKLLGIDANDSYDIDEIIKLKTINPEQPVYISMNWGDADAFGKRDGRHALRLKSVVAKNGTYEFILVNPWDNQSEKSFSLDDIKTRKYRFCNFSTDKVKYAVTQALLKCPKEHGTFIFSHPDLLNLLIQMQKIGVVLSPKNIESCLNLHKKMPYLLLLLNSLLPIEQEKMMHTIIDANGNQETFLKSFIKTFVCKNTRELFEKIKKLMAINPELGKDLFSLARSQKNFTFGVSYDEFAKNLLSETTSEFKTWFIFTHELSEQDNANKVINSYVEQIKSIQTVNNGTTTEAIDLQHKTLVNTLQAITTNKVDLANAQQALGHNQQHPLIYKAIVKKGRQIGKSAQDQLLKITNAEMIVGMYIQKINDLLVEFNTCFTIEAVTLRYSSLISKMESICLHKAELNQALHALGLTNQHPTIVKMLENKKQIIQKTAEQQLLVLNNAMNVVKGYQKQIITFPVSFNKALTIQDISELSTHQLTELNNIVKDKNDLTKAHQTLGFANQHEYITFSLSIKKLEIEEGAKLAKNRLISRNEALKIMQQINFPQQLQTIKNMTLALEQKAKQNEGYKKIANSAQRFYQSLVIVEENYLTADKSKERNLLNFKSGCVKARSNELSILNKQPEWKQILDDLERSVRSISSPGGVYLTTTRNGLFTQQANLDQITHGLDGVNQTTFIAA